MYITPLNITQHNHTHYDDTQNNYIQLNNSQQNGTYYYFLHNHTHNDDTQHNYTQLNDILYNALTLMAISTVALSKMIFCLMTFSIKDSQ